MVDKRTLIIGGMVVALSIFVAIVAIVSAVYFVVQDFSDRTESAKRLGREFGNSADQKGCMTEGLKRSRTMTKYDIVKLVENGDFVEGCFETSRPTTDFCTSVPLFRESSEGQWEYKQCSESKMDPDKTGCKSIYEEHLMFCHRQSRSAQ